MIRSVLGVVLAIATCQISWSDSIANYQHISQSIPKMEIKADEQSQAWARSARHVLTITNESIAETLVAMNEEATKQGQPFFCLPKNQLLDAQNLGRLLEKASQNQFPNNKTTVSQIALEMVKKKYPCRISKHDTVSVLTQTQAAMQHAEAAAQ